jgi:hypothetical protein
MAVGLNVALSFMQSSGALKDTRHAKPTEAASASFFAPSPVILSQAERASTAINKSEGEARMITP